MAARLLAGEGIGIRVLLTGRQADLKGDAAAALAALKDSTAEEIVEELTDELAADTDELTDLLSARLTSCSTRWSGPASSRLCAARRPVCAMSSPAIQHSRCRGRPAQRLGRRLPGASPLRTPSAPMPWSPSPRPSSAHVFGHLTPGVFGPVVVAEIGSAESAVQSTIRICAGLVASKATHRKAAPDQQQQG